MIPGRPKAAYFEEDSGHGLPEWCISRCVGKAFHSSSTSGFLLGVGCADYQEEFTWICHTVIPPSLLLVDRFEWLGLTSSDQRFSTALFP